MSVAVILDNSQLGYVLTDKIEALAADTNNDIKERIAALMVEAILIYDQLRFTPK